MRMGDSVAYKREYRYEGDILYLKCSKCGNWLTLDRFPKDKERPLGVRCDCRLCHKSDAKEYHKRWYINNKEHSNKSCREYHQKNKVKINLNIRNKVEIHTNELGFSRYKFHARAKYHAKINNLRPSECPICGETKTVLMHHPSYESFDKWSEVVFCCKGCHSKIHNGEIECPKPVNLLLLSKRINC